MNIKITVILALTLLFSSLLAAEDTPGNTITAGAFEAVSVTAANAAPVPLYNALGFEIGMVSKVIPGISYTRIFTPETSICVFAGGIYDRDGMSGLLQVNGYYLFNEYLYAGLGISASFDEDGSVIMGFANPSLGVISAITDNIKLYIETTILLFTYTSKPDLDSATPINNPVPILKLGVKYYF